MVSEQFGKAYWDDRYRGHDAPHQAQPNPYLVTVAGELPPGTALDAGCGEGAEAAWLAARGWLVTAVDVAATALRRAREHAETLGADVAGRITWREADLTTWTPVDDHYDLVCTHYVHLAAPGEALFRRLAAAVAPGGTLLVVGHHPGGPDTATSHPPAPGSHLTAEQVTAALDPRRWDITVAEARTRPAGTHHGHEVTLHDAVVRARKHR